MPKGREMRRYSKREEGQAVVELALVLPLMLMLLFGIVQFGTVFRDYIALTDATRVGARQAAVARSIQPESDRIPRVVAMVERAAVNLNKSQIVVTVEPVKVDGVTPGWEESGDVTVRATYPFKINIAGMVLFSGTLKSRTTERVE
jgi:Flp pilus assembly protein TadG